MEAIWTFLNSGIGLTIIGTIVAFALGRLFLSTPEVEKWKGIIIEAVKAAEKIIPDNTVNAGARRLDEAMKYFIKVYEEQALKSPASTLLDAVRLAIPEIHADLEAMGNLDSKPPMANGLSDMAGKAMTLLLVGVLLFGAIGCGQSPAQQIMNARDSLATALDATIVLYDAKKIDREQLKMIYEIGRSAQASIDRAEAANQLGNQDDFKYYLAIARAAVQEFLAMRIAAERTAADKKGKAANGQVSTRPAVY